MISSIRVRSILLGILFAISPIVTIFIAEVLKNSYNYSPKIFYGLLLLLQMFIGFVGEKINQIEKTGDTGKVLKIYVIIPVALLSILPLLMRGQGLGGTGYTTLYLEALSGYLFQICGLVSVLCFFATSWIGSRKRKN